MRTQAVSERFKIGPVPISKDGGATLQTAARTKQRCRETDCVPGI
jgi:hypothetical protein